MAIYLKTTAFCVLAAGIFMPVSVSSDHTVSDIFERLSYLERKVAITEQLQRENEILKTRIIRNEEKMNVMETKYLNALNELQERITEQDRAIKYLKLNCVRKEEEDEKARSINKTLNAISSGGDGHVITARPAGKGKAGQSRIRKHLGDSPTVAFAASLSHNLEHIHSGQVVAFDHINLNEGNVYNSSSGIFVCPKSGVYLFSYNLHLELSSSHLGIEIKVNGREIVRSYTSTTSTQSKGNVPGTTLVRLNMGDRVWASCFSKQSRIYGGLISHFVGARIGD